MRPINIPALLKSRTLYMILVAAIMLIGPRLSGLPLDEAHAVEIVNTLLGGLALVAAALGRVFARQEITPPPEDEP